MLPPLGQKIPGLSKNSWSIPGLSKIDARAAFFFISFFKGMLFAEMASIFLVSKCKH